MINKTINRFLFQLQILSSTLKYKFYGHHLPSYIRVLILHSV